MCENVYYFLVEPLVESLLKVCSLYFIFKYMKMQNIVLFLGFGDVKQAQEVNPTEQNRYLLDI